MAAPSIAAAAPASVAHAGQPVMGTILQVTVVGDDVAGAERLAAEAIGVARRWDDVLTTWRPEGELARLNARAGEGPIAVSRDLSTALDQMRSLSQVTGGAFDPAVGPLVALWREASGPPATPRACPAACRLEGALTVRAGRVELAAGAALDAGAIGKGIALDAIATMLREKGVRAAFLDFGGSSQLAIGAPPDSPAGWKVALAGVDTGTLLGFLDLRDAALSTSRASAAGNPAGPIIDPRDGRPVEPPRLGTILARDATTADAWSTALVVLGRDGLRQIEAAGLEALYEDRSGVVRTAGFRRIGTQSR